MTDNEIIKALECSVNGKCPECPYFRSYPCDKCRNMRKDALDLINRLQAENSNLTSDLTSLQNDLTSAKAEIERLKKEKDEYAYLYEKHINTAFSHIKAEAYKEFANWQEVKLANNPNISTVAFQSIIKTNDNLLKELERADNV